MLLTKKYLARCDNYLNNALRKRRADLSLLNINIYNYKKKSKILETDEKYNRLVKS